MEWDAVELPSQFMENFCWEWEVLRDMTRHVDTSAPLPRELFDRVLAAKNFLSGMATVRQVEMGLFDMLLHAQFDGAAGTPWPTREALLAAVRREVAVIPRAPYDRFMEAKTSIKPLPPPMPRSAAGGTSITIGAPSCCTRCRGR